MTLVGLIIFLVVGAIAGWIAGQIMSGGGFGLVGNIIVGVIGALIGGWVFSLLGIAVYGLIGSIIAAVIGAVILLALLRLIRPRLAPELTRSGVGGGPGCGMIPRRRTPRHFPENRPGRRSTQKPARYMRFTQNSHNLMIYIQPQGTTRVGSSPCCRSFGIFCATCV